MFFINKNKENITINFTFTTKENVSYIGGNGLNATFKTSKIFKSTYIQIMFNLCNENNVKIIKYKEKKDGLIDTKFKFYLKGNRLDISKTIEEYINIIGEWIKNIYA